MRFQNSVILLAVVISCHLLGASAYFHHPYYAGHPVIRENLNEAGAKLDSLINHFDPWRPALVSRPVDVPLTPYSWALPALTHHLPLTYHHPIPYAQPLMPYHGINDHPFDDAFAFGDPAKPKKIDPSQTPEVAAAEEQRPPIPEGMPPNVQAPEPQAPEQPKMGQEMTSGSPSTLGTDQPTDAPGSPDGANKAGRFDLVAFGVAPQSRPYWYDPYYYAGGADQPEAFMAEKNPVQGVPYPYPANVKGSR